MLDKIVVITGASSGIGAALAEALASTGASLGLVARREAELEAVAKACGERAYPIKADMTRRPEVRDVVERVVQRFGRIDVWVNNVGRGITRLPSELSDDDLDEMMRVNVKSALYGIQEVLPHFKARGTGQIINVSSMLGRMPLVPQRSAYNGAKHFLNALTANLRAELQDTHQGIDVSLVSPGIVWTEFGRHALHGGPDSHGLPGGQGASEVARVIVGIIESPRPDVYTRPGAKDRVAAYFAQLGADP